MLKPQKYNIEDTNLANFGTELEKNVKKAAAETEDAWKPAGKEPYPLIILFYYFLYFILISLLISRFLDFLISFYLLLID